MPSSVFCSSRYVPTWAGVCKTKLQIITVIYRLLSELALKMILFLQSLIHNCRRKLQ